MGEKNLNWNTIMVAFPKKHVYSGQGLKLPYPITPKARFSGDGSASNKISTFRIKLPSRAGDPQQIVLTRRGCSYWHCLNGLAEELREDKG